MGKDALYQHTLKDIVELFGIGLHTGVSTRIFLRPAPPNTGIVLTRSDKKYAPSVHALCDGVTQSYLATTIGCNGTGITTVEHLLAALFGCGVDNVIVDVSGPEIPICDGSALAYVQAILRTGLEQQNEFRSFLSVVSSAAYHDGDAYLEVRPADELIVTYSIEFDHPSIGYQHKSWKYSVEKFIREIAPARTFGFLKDAEKLQAQGLGLGGSLENAVIFDDTGVINSEGLRFTDECVRHKILDFLGDILLLGKRVLGHFRIHKGGHSLHHRFLKKLSGELKEIKHSAIPLKALDSFRPIDSGVEIDYLFNIMPLQEDADNRIYSQEPG